MESVHQDTWRLLSQKYYYKNNSETRLNHKRCEVLTAVNIGITVFWVVIPYRLVTLPIFWRNLGVFLYPKPVRSSFLQNVGT
jgi:hypothetical protein